MAARKLGEGPRYQNGWSEGLALVREMGAMDGGSIITSMFDGLFALVNGSGVSVAMKAVPVVRAGKPGFEYAAFASNSEEKHVRQEEVQQALRDWEKSVQVSG